MSTRKKCTRKQLLSLVCGAGLALSQATAFAALQQDQQARPKINLFPTSVVESLSQTSQAARDMESGMYEVVSRLDKQNKAYQGTNCENSDDKGCLQLRGAIRTTYKAMLDVMQASIPDMRRSLEATTNSMGGSLRGEIGRLGILGQRAHHGSVDF